MTEPDPGLQAANKALAEVGIVRRTVTEIQKRSRAASRSTIDQRDAEEKAAQARLQRPRGARDDDGDSPVAQATPEPAAGQR